MLDTMQFQGETFWVAQQAPTLRGGRRVAESEPVAARNASSGCEALRLSHANRRAARSPASRVSRCRSSHARRCPEFPSPTRCGCEEYDGYYYNANGARTLPVLRVRYADPQQTWLYLDPTRGAVVQRSESITRLRRWLYQGLHSLDFPFLYYKRPLWDIVVIVLSLGGLALSVTTLTPALRRLLRHMKARTAISGRLLVVVAGGGRKWFDRGEANPPPAGAP